jgi:methyl-accepting chemotaxis protein
MAQAFIRRPIGNFFIKKELQVRLMAKIIAVVFLSTLVCMLSLLLVYFMRYQSVLFYQLDAQANLSKENIIDLLAPSLAVSAVVNILVGLAVGLYASRKYAVPIYKLEQWATMLQKGKLNTKLRFREREEMKELSDKCNTLADELRMKFNEIKQTLDEIEGEKENTGRLEHIQHLVSSLETDNDEIQIHTGFHHLNEEDVPEQKE